MHTRLLGRHAHLAAHVKAQTAQRKRKSCIVRAEGSSAGKPEYGLVSSAGFGVPGHGLRLRNPRVQQLSCSLL